MAAISATTTARGDAPTVDEDDSGRRCAASGETPGRCDATARRPARRPRCTRVLLRSRRASDAGASDAGARAAAVRGAVGPIGDVRVSTQTGAVIVNIVAGLERGPASARGEGARAGKMGARVERRGR